MGTNNDKMGSKVWIYKIWYKIYKFWIHDYLQVEAQDSQAIQELLTSFIKISDSWLEHQGNKRVAQGVVNGWMRDRVVIDNGSV